MFSFKQIQTIAIASLAGTVLLTASVAAQQSEFERRADAMRRARSRQMDSEPVVDGYRTAARISEPEYVAPPVPPRTARAPNATQRTRVAQLPAGARMAKRSGSMGTRVAQNLGSGVIIDEGYPVGSGYVEDGYYEEGPGCTSCGDSGAYFEGGCGCDDGGCCGRGGCPPGNCWLSGLGGILYNGEYFFGATGFQGTNYPNPVAGANDIHDCNFGFYGGANFGVPLCNLTCGVLSGQVGVRSVQSNFSGNEFSDESRDQLFVTAGLYRRVDYGLQFGIVGDFLQDEFYADASIAQIRAELAWVYAGGCQMGFRYTAAQEDDVVDGVFDGANFTDQVYTVEDQYRFFVRSNGNGGGYGELFAGWTESDQTILGMDFDMPLHERIAIESNFTYFLNDEGPAAGFLGGNAGEAWNLAVGFVLRPQGRSHYRSYDRPLFDVADNGSMLIRRSN